MGKSPQVSPRLFEYFSCTYLRIYEWVRNCRKGFLPSLSALMGPPDFLTNGTEGRERERVRKKYIHKGVCYIVIWSPWEEGRCSERVVRAKCSSILNQSPPQKNKNQMLSIWTGRRSHTFSLSSPPLPKNDLTFSTLLMLYTLVPSLLCLLQTTFTTHRIVS